MADQRLADPGERGRTIVADRVVERIACFAAAEVDGVRSVGSSLESLVGRRYPKADADIAGNRARVVVSIAVTWPTPLARTSAAVRDQVLQRLRDYSGLEIDAVDVTAAKVLSDADENRGRVA